MTQSPHPAPARRIDALVKAAFLAALREGHRREDAAVIAGFSLMGLYGARQRDPAFASAWQDALAAIPVAERRPAAAPEPGEVRIAPANRRLYQRRRRRHVRFDLERQALFLAHFAATCDTKAAAAAAGIHPSTVTLRRRTCRAFAEAFRETLASGYVLLEAEALRLGLAAQQRNRAAAEHHVFTRTGGDAARAGACPVCGRDPDGDAEFDQVMRLLARHDRKPRRAERAFKPGGQRQRWTFEEAIEALDKRLRALGLRTAAAADGEAGKTFSHPFPQPSPS